jgi:hypothetical protein
MKRDISILAFLLNRFDALPTPSKGFLKKLSWARVGLLSLRKVLDTLINLRSFIKGWPQKTKKSRKSHSGHVQMVLITMPALKIKTRMLSFWTFRPTWGPWG